MNDLAATTLLLHRMTDDHNLTGGVTSLAGGHYAVHVETYGNLGYASLLAIWSADGTGTGESGAAVVLQHPDRDDWDNYTYVLWETGDLVSPDVVAMVTEDAMGLLDEPWHDPTTDGLDEIRRALEEEWS